MQTSDLDFDCPADLIALEPSRPTRVAWCEGSQPVKELTLEELLARFHPGDLLVRNQTQVIPARVFSQNEVEVLFLRATHAGDWQVLFPARALKVGESLAMPGGLTLTLMEKSLPQVVRPSFPLELSYFDQYGELALPPYIQSARGERHNRAMDTDWYQTAWAKVPGSVAAPTASLHFQAPHIRSLQERGVQVADVTLHVGAGTFLPVRTDDLSKHVMHEEWAHVSQSALHAIAGTRARGGRIWALGTTVARTLESLAQGLLERSEDGASGMTKLFLYPPYDFKNVDVLLTNFHQPRSTLLALVAAFAGLDQVKANYRWAIENRFRMFSYGDLSAWKK